jgi:hypothetical protein
MSESLAPSGRCGCRLKASGHLAKADASRMAAARLTVIALIPGPRNCAYDGLPLLPTGRLGPNT